MFSLLGPLSRLNWTVTASQGFLVLVTDSFRRTDQTLYRMPSARLCVYIHIPLAGGGGHTAYVLAFTVLAAVCVCVSKQVNIPAQVSSGRPSLGVAEKAGPGMEADSGLALKTELQARSWERALLCSAESACVAPFVHSYIRQSFNQHDIS